MKGELLWSVIVLALVAFAVAHPSFGSSCVVR